MFKRDDVYDILVQLTGQAMQRWLNNGASQSVDGYDRNDGLVIPLKKDLAARKRNEMYNARFRLPASEQLLDGMDATYVKEGSHERDPIFLSQVPPGIVNLIGRVYISQTFIAFESEERLPPPQQHLPVCKAVFPLYTIKRVERINQGAYTSGVALTTWHKMEHSFYLHVSKPACTIMN
jgi:hypothetical protein